MKFQTVYTKTGTSDDAAPTNGAAAPTGSFGLDSYVDPSRLTPVGSIDVYAELLDGAGADIAGAYWTAQLWRQDSDNGRWNTVGAPFRLQAGVEAHVPVPAPNVGGGRLYLQLTGASGAPTTTRVHVAPSGALSSIETARAESGAGGGGFGLSVLARYVAAASSLVDGAWSALRASIWGGLLVSLGDEIAGENRSDGAMMTVPRAISSTTGAWSQYASAAKVGTVGVFIKASAGRVRDISAVNTNATTLLYLLVVDKATAPINNDLPAVAAIPLPANTAASVASGGGKDFGDAGATLANGLAYAVSTTADKVTLPATSDAMVFARYA